MPQRSLPVDVLGFVMPGLVLLGLVVGPFVGAPGLGAAVLALALSYVVGVVLHEVVRPWVDTRAPLPPSDDPIQVAFAAKVHDRFGLEVDSPRDREQALALARTALVDLGRAHQAEQLHALQAVCRGLFGALVLGTAWGIGLATGVLPLGVALVLILGAGFAVARATGWFDRMFDADPAIVALPVAGVGLAVAGAILSPLVSVGQGVVALLAVLAAAFLAGVARRAHERYAGSFAEAVIHGFVALDPGGRSPLRQGPRSSLRSTE